MYKIRSTKSQILTSPQRMSSHSLICLFKILENSNLSLVRVTRSILLRIEIHGEEAEGRNYREAQGNHWNC